MASIFQLQFRPRSNKSQSTLRCFSGRRRKDVARIHPRNLYQGNYDMTRLQRVYPALSEHIIAAQSRRRSTVDFSCPRALVSLNKAILLADYKIEHWDLHESKLCPPIPGRADYLHHLADLLAENSSAEGSVLPPRGPSICGLDIGTGASCVYPILGTAVYGWSFIATEVDSGSFKSAKSIVAANSSSTREYTDLSYIDIRLQANQDRIFEGVLGGREEVDFVMCNPPFHKSAQEAAEANLRKGKNLAAHRQRRGNSSGSRSAADTAMASNKDSHLNFGGERHELWCRGGELVFIKRLVAESANGASLAQRCLWFSSLVSRHTNLAPIQHALASTAGVEDVRVVEMGQGQKRSRFVAWTYHTRAQIAAWRARRRW